MTYRLHDLPLGDRYHRAEMHFSRGMYALAREEFSALLSEPYERPVEDEAEIRWRLANCCAALGQTEKADETVSEALLLPGLSERSRARLEAVRGFSAYSRGDYATAQRACENAAVALRERGDHVGLPGRKFVITRSVTQATEYSSRHLR